MHKGFQFVDMCWWSTLIQEIDNGVNSKKIITVDLVYGQCRFSAKYNRLIKCHMVESYITVLTPKIYIKHQS